MKNLKDIRKLDDNKIADDDHLERDDITKKEFNDAVDELADDHKLKPVKDKPISPFAQASIDALNKLKMIFLLWLFNH